MVIRNGGSKNSTSPPYLVKNERSLTLTRPLEILTIQLTIVLHSDWKMVIWIGKVKIFANK